MVFAQRVDLGVAPTTLNREVIDVMIWRISVEAPSQGMVGEVVSIDADKSDRLFDDARRVIGKAALPIAPCLVTSQSQSKVGGLETRTDQVDPVDEYGGYYQSSARN